MFQIIKKEFHASEKLTALDLVDIDKILVSDKFKHIDNGSKYFIGYIYYGIIMPLCIVLPQMGGYIKCFDNDRKNISFEIGNGNILVKYIDIWNKIKKTFDIKFQSKPVCDEKYIKVKVKIFNGIVNTVFSDNKILKKHVTTLSINI